MNADAPNANQGGSSDNIDKLKKGISFFIRQGISRLSPIGLCVDFLWDAFGDEIVAGALWFKENVFPTLKDIGLTGWDTLKFFGEISIFGQLKSSLSELKETLFPEEDSRPHGTLADVKHISDKEYLAAAEMAYEPANPDGKRAKFREQMQEALRTNGWKEVKDLNVKVSNINGFGGKVWVNHKKKTVMVAFRGTEPPSHRGWGQTAKDLLTDIQLTLGYNDNIQLRSAQELLDNVKNDPKYKDYQLVIVGHSLGGWFGEKKGIENKIPTVTFNAPGVQNNLTESERAKDRAGKYNDLIRNYVNPDDVIGTFGKHVGETYYMMEDRMVKIPERRLDDDKISTKLEQAWNYGIDTKHGLEELAKQLSNGGNFEGVVR